MLKFDFLGKPLNLYYKNKDKMNSNLGGCLSIILVILCGVMIFAFGLNFFERINPKIALSTYTLTDYPLNYVNNNNFTFAFRVEDCTGTWYEDDANYFFEFYWNKNLKKPNGEWDYGWGDINYTKCTKDQFVDQDFAERTDIGAMYCANFENSTVLIGGFWDGNFINTIQLNLRPCVENSTNPITGVECLPDSQKSSINNKYVSIYTQYTIIDTANYKPVLKSVIKSEYFTLDERLRKLHYLFFKEVEVVSDYGWIIENKLSEKRFGVVSSYLDVFSNSEFLNHYKRTSYYSETILYGHRERDIIQRHYDRIQTLAAEVGGLLKFVMVIFSYIVNYYSECLVVLELSDLLNSNNTKKSNNVNKSLRLGNNNVSQKSILYLSNLLYYFNKNDSKIISKETLKVNSDIAFINKNVIRSGDNSYENNLVIDNLNKIILDPNNYNDKHLVIPNTNLVKSENYDKNEDYQFNNINNKSNQMLNSDIKIVS